MQALLLPEPSVPTSSMAPGNNLIRRHISKLTGGKTEAQGRPLCAWGQSPSRASFPRVAGWERLFSPASQGGPMGAALTQEGVGGRWDKGWGWERVR